jgi:hypothetical protein
VTASPKRARQRDRRERVTGVAEGGDEEGARSPSVPSLRLRRSPHLRTILSMRRRDRDAARRLRRAVDRLPQRTKEAMLRGIDANRIIVGAYVDPSSGGICPMLAAHRNGGRTNVASFARAWDAYTGAKRPRRASRREVTALRAMLGQSLALDPTIEHASIAELAAQIRAEREELARCERDRAPRPRDLPVDEPATPAAPAPDHDQDPEPERGIRVRRRRPAPYLDLLTIAETALAEQGTWERADERKPV